MSPTQDELSPRRRAILEAATTVLARKGNRGLTHRAVDREAGLFEQIVTPLLKQRNPEARVRATRTVTELIRLGEVMRGVLLRRELRDHIGGG